MKAISRFIWIVVLTTFCVACGGNGNGKSQQEQVQPPEPPVVTVGAGLKQLIFSWAEVSGVTHYKLLENPDGHSGFTQVGANMPNGTLSVTRHIAVHLHDFANALYMLQACNGAGCTISTEVSVANLMFDTVGYIKASNAEQGRSHSLDEFPTGDRFGAAVALSADGSTLAVGAPGEDGGSTGINGDQSDNSAWDAGAVYIFRLIGGEWLQQDYIKASNAGGGDPTSGDLFTYDEGDRFGSAVSLSSDGNTLAVGAQYEGSSATGVNGDQDDNSALHSGAAYVFRFDGTDWRQQAYIKASNTEGYFQQYLADRFGQGIALNADGNTLAVGAPGEDSNATGIDGDQTDNSVSSAGAVYVFRFDGTDWSQQAYVKTSIADELDRYRGDQFGWAVVLSTDGNTLAVGGSIFRFDGTDWFEQACVMTDTFGHCRNGSSALSADGNMLALGAYIFRFDGVQWTQRGTVTDSITEEGYELASPDALSDDGNILAVRAHRYDSDSGSRDDAVYIIQSIDGEWTHHPYLEAHISDRGANYNPCDYYTNDDFGRRISMSGDGNTLAVGAPGEDSNATGIGGDQSDNSACGSGAVYLY
jgi:hypothetical protein